MPTASPKTSRTPGYLVANHPCSTRNGIEQPIRQKTFSSHVVPVVVSAQLPPRRTALRSRPVSLMSGLVRSKCRRSETAPVLAVDPKVCAGRYGVSNDRPFDVPVSDEKDWRTGVRFGAIRIEKLGIRTLKQRTHRDPPTRGSTPCRRWARREDPIEPLYSLPSTASGWLITQSKLTAPGLGWT